MLPSTSEFLARRRLYSCSPALPTLSVCHHFKLSRMDLWQIVKIKKLRDFPTIIATVGSGSDSQGW